MNEFSHLCQAVSVEYLDVTAIAADEPALGELAEGFRDCLRCAADQLGDVIITESQHVIIMAHGKKVPAQTFASLPPPQNCTNDCL